QFSSAATTSTMESESRSAANDFSSRHRRGGCRLPLRGSHRRCGSLHWSLRWRPLGSLGEGCSRAGDDLTGEGEPGAEGQNQSWVTSAGVAPLDESRQGEGYGSRGRVAAVDDVAGDDGF